MDKYLLDHLSRVLAVVIAENGDYSHVDKLGYVVSPDLAVYYLREALRDYSSLQAKTVWNNPLAKKEAEKIKMDLVEKALDKIIAVDDPREIRRIVSAVAAKALARANLLRTKPVEEEVAG
ncbi:MAG: type I-A CRISPR-associated protein Csa5 [Crenarchaeota archaeon]|nr:type I-A CRISPR-associated protein Csa5 [Thermoproteota archaeon]